MFVKKSKPVVCAVCGKAIAPKDSRIVDKNRTTKEERHVHLDCRIVRATQPT
jgi:hypothetical protein